MTPEQLQSLKYADLRSLAKSAGIRANQKVEKLIKALTDYYKNSTEEEADGDEETENTATDITEMQVDMAKSPSTDEEGRKSKGTKRRRTFELDEPTLKGDNTPVVASDETHTSRLRCSKTPQSEPRQPVKRLRRDTCEKKSPTAPVTPLCKKKTPKGSPSAKSILDAINVDCSSAERKEQLLSAIGKKVQAKMAATPAKPVKGQTSQIPRFMAFLTTKKAESQGNKTPGGKNWNKIHKKEFEKFDSIDVYLERKHQRKENLSTSTKKKQPSQKSPAVKPSAKAARQLTKISEPSKIFKPTVRSTKNMNFDFSKHALELNSKTPSKSKITNTPSKSKITNTPSRRQPPTSCSKATPFKFTGNTTSSLNTTAALSATKPKFDLKASLAKPLTWKPHTGKLQRVDTNSTQNTAPVRTFNASSLNVTSRILNSSSLKGTSRVRATASRDPANRNKQRKANKSRRKMYAGQHN